MIVTAERSKMFGNVIMKAKEKKISKKTIRLVIALVLLCAVLTGLALSWFGSTETAQFNLRSLTDYRLGGRVSGIKSLDEAREGTKDGYVYFSDSHGEGIATADGRTRYYLGRHPALPFGGCRVIGFATTAKSYTVLGIRVGSDELAARNTIMDLNYTVMDAGVSSFRAEKGRITIELDVSDGVVTRMAAWLR